MPISDLFLRDKKRKREVFLDPRLALDGLADACGLLEGLGVRCWLTDGTLLGFYRDNAFIGHDRDVDLGCLASDYSDAVVPAFRSHGWKIKRVFGTRSCGLEISFVKAELKLDLFFFYEEDGRYWHGAWRRQDRRRNLIKYYYDRFDLGRATFLGLEFPVPSDMLTYVRTKYGENWRTPVKEWDWALSPANAHPTEIWRADSKPLFGRWVVE